MQTYSIYVENEVVLLVISFLLKVMRRWIASRIQLCRNCIVLVNWCRVFGAELQAGAKCPNWEECTETIQRGALISTSSCIISECTKWQNHAFHWKSGVWSCGASAEEERARKGSCRLKLASAPNPAPCQQLSMEGNANLVSLHDSTKAFGKWEEELRIRI